MSSVLENKINKILLNLGPTCTLVSGGVDSSLMAYLAHQINPLSISAIAVSESLYQDSLEVAKYVSGYIGMVLLEVPTTETRNSEYMLNTPRRCAVCREVTVGEITQKLSPGFIFLSGVNTSDVGELPGIEAMSKSGVRHVLKEAGITKPQVIQMAKNVRLPNWNRPSMACLSSSVPRGISISPEQLVRLGRGLRIIHDQIPDSANFVTRIRELRPGTALVVTQQEMLDDITEAQKADVTEKLINIGYSEVQFGLYVHGQMNS